VVVAINRDFDRLANVDPSCGMGDLSEKIRLAHDGFVSYARDFAALVSAEVKLGLN